MSTTRPTYIVDYIVEHTVGKLLEGKRPGPRGGASRLKIVDPACGSGSFLIGAYQYLLDWHRDRYVEDGPEKWSKVLYEGPGGEWHLTIDEKKRILTQQHLRRGHRPPGRRGHQALPAPQGPRRRDRRDSLADASYGCSQERALPDLDDNIKCGNSLIGPDFYDERADDAPRRRGALPHQRLRLEARPSRRSSKETTLASTL